MFGACCAILYHIKAAFLLKQVFLFQSKINNQLLEFIDCASSQNPTNREKWFENNFTLFCKTL